MNEDVLNKLDALRERIDAAIAAASGPKGERWLDAAGVGAKLSYTAQYVRETLAVRPDFPRPLREGNPRWPESEIDEWALSQRNGKHRAGRKRAA